MVYTEVEETKQFKGCIARMITQRKVNICKLINKYAEKTHQLEIKVNRTKEEIEREGKRKPRPHNAFSISGATQAWYLLDGKQFNVLKENEQGVKELQQQLEKLEERLEEEIKEKENMVRRNISYNTYLNFFNA